MKLSHEYLAHELQVLQPAALPRSKQRNWREQREYVLASNSGRSNANWAK
jgi:hypothetical protein